MLRERLFDGRRRPAMARHCGGVWAAACVPVPSARLSGIRGCMDR